MPRCRPLLAVLLGLTVGGCLGARTPRSAGLMLPAPDADALPDNWRQSATPADLTRFARLDDAWKAGLAAARAAGHAGDLTGPLFDPVSAQPRAAPPPGVYRCRVVRLGDGAKRRERYAAFPAAYCYVKAEGALLTFTKGTGSERPGGRLYGDGDARMVFLGSLATGLDKLPPPYGARAERDRIGAFERIGDFRWRLALPFPIPGVALQLIELTPDPVGIIPPK